MKLKIVLAMVILLVLFIGQASAIQVVASDTVQQSDLTEGTNTRGIPDGYGSLSPVLGFATNTVLNGTVNISFSIQGSAGDYTYATIYIGGVYGGGTNRSKANEGYTTFTETFTLNNVPAGTLIELMAYSNGGTAYGDDLYLNYTSFDSISFVTPPTPANNSVITVDYTTVNASITAPNRLKNMTWNWNGVGYNIMNSSLIANFNFNNNSAIGETTALVVDVSQYGNNGTINGATWQNNGSLYCDGSNDWIDISNTGTVYSPTSGYSILLKLKGIGAGQADKKLYAEGSTTDGDPIFAIGTENTGADGKLRVFIRNNTGTTPLYSQTTSTIPFDGNTHVILWTDNAGDAALYIDGTLDSTNFDYTPGTAYSMNTKSICALRRAVVSNNLTAFIDEFRAYNYSMNSTQAEIISNSLLTKTDSNNWNLNITQTSLVHNITYPYFVSFTNLTNGLFQTETRNIRYDDNRLPSPPVPTMENYTVVRTQNTARNSTSNFSLGYDFNASHISSLKVNFTMISGSIADLKVKTNANSTWSGTWSGTAIDVPYSSGEMINYLNYSTADSTTTFKATVEIGYIGNEYYVVIQDMFNYFLSTGRLNTTTGHEDWRKYGDNLNASKEYKAYYEESLLAFLGSVLYRSGYNTSSDHYNITSRLISHNFEEVLNSTDGVDENHSAYHEPFTLAFTLMSVERMFNYSKYNDKLYWNNSLNNYNHSASYMVAPWMCYPTAEIHNWGIMEIFSINWLYKRGYTTNNTLWEGGSKGCADNISVRFNDRVSNYGHFNNASGADPSTGYNAFSLYWAELAIDDGYDNQTFINATGRLKKFVKNATLKDGNFIGTGRSHGSPWIQGAVASVAWIDQYDPDWIRLSNLSFNDLNQFKYTDPYSGENTGMYHLERNFYDPMYKTGYSSSSVWENYNTLTGSMYAHIAERFNSSLLGTNEIDLFNNITMEDWDCVTTPSCTRVLSVNTGNYSLYTTPTLFDVPSQNASGMVPFRFMLAKYNINNPGISPMIDDAQHGVADNLGGTTGRHQPEWDAAYFKKDGVAKHINYSQWNNSNASYSKTSDTINVQYKTPAFPNETTRDWGISWINYTYKIVGDHIDITKKVTFNTSLYDYQVEPFDLIMNNGKQEASRTIVGTNLTYLMDDADGTERFMVYNVSVTNGTIEMVNENTYGWTSFGYHNRTVLQGNMTSSPYTLSYSVELLEFDETPPASITNAQTTIGSNYILNTWINPADPDLDYIQLNYSNGTSITTIGNGVQFWNNTNLTPHYQQNISAQTVDTSGNMNSTLVWFNATIPNNAPVQDPIDETLTITEGDLLWINLTSSDADSDSLTYATNRSDLFTKDAGFNFSWQTTTGDAGTYNVNFNTTDTPYDGQDNETITITVNSATAPAIISWGNDITNDQDTNISVTTGTTIRFNATANQTITSWTWRRVKP